MARRGNVDSHLKSFFKWLRLQPCVQCDGGNWDMDKGEYCNDVSHVLKKGSTRRNEHFNNTVAHCRPCHIFFESLPKSDREKLLPLAREMYSKYCEVSS